MDKNRIANLAWAAGFLDGEGCFSLSHGRTRLILRIVQVDREVLEKFQSAVGLGNISGLRNPPSHSGRPFYVYTVGGAKVTQVAEMLWPYMGTIKQNQYRSCLTRRTRS